MDGINEAEVRDALYRLDPLWVELFPAERARIVQLLVKRVDVSPDGADIWLRTEGLTIWSPICARAAGIAEGGVMGDQRCWRWSHGVSVRADLDQEARWTEARPGARLLRRNMAAYKPNTGLGKPIKP